MRAFVFALCSLLPLSAQGLRYHAKLWFRGAQAPVEGRFIVDTTEPTRSHNRVQRARMGSWIIRPVAGEDRAAEALVLARAPSLLFLSTAVPQALPTRVRVKLGPRSCAFWGLRTPSDLVASVALAEVAPHLLALLDLTAQPTGGDLERVEVHLEAFEGLSSSAPPQDGTALLGTLETWARGQKTELASGVTVLR